MKKRGRGSQPDGTAVVLSYCGTDTQRWSNSWGGKRWGGEAQPDRQYNSVSYLVGALSPVSHRGLHQGSQIDGTTVVVR